MHAKIFTFLDCALLSHHHHFFSLLFIWFGTMCVKYGGKLDCFSFQHYFSLIFKKKNFCRKKFSQLTRLFICIPTTSIWFILVVFSIIVIISIEMCILLPSCSIFRNQPNSLVFLILLFNKNRHANKLISIVMARQQRRLLCSAGMSC